MSRTARHRNARDRWFADSPLEGDGFEPSVPGRETVNPIVGDGTACSKTETPLRRLESGVSIQAQLVDSLLAGDLLRRPAFAPALERLLALVPRCSSLAEFGPKPMPYSAAASLS